MLFRPRMIARNRPDLEKPGWLFGFAHWTGLTGEISKVDG
jgi:hypothetical protein